MICADFEILFIIFSSVYASPKVFVRTKAMNYMNETVVDEDDFLRFRISERFNQILRDTFKLYQENVREDIPKRKDSINEMTSDILSVLDQIKAGGIKLDSPDQAIELMAKQMGLNFKSADEIIEDFLSYDNDDTE